MAQPLRPKTLNVRVKDNSHHIRREQRKPNIPGPFIYVGDFDTLTPPVVTWQSPPWQNNFTWFGTRYVGFRHGLDGELEFIGTLDLTQGAVTGTVAFTLPVPWQNRSFDFPFPIYTGGTDWETGVFSIDQTNGECTVYWPTQATVI